MLPSIAQVEIEDSLRTIANILDIDSNEGDLLDIAGRIVGVGRDYRARLAEAQEIIDADPEHTDVELFRVLIRAKIAQNNGDASIDNISESVSFVFGADRVQVFDSQDMTFFVLIIGDLSPIERFAVLNFDIVPRPQGVRFTAFLEAISPPFGHSDLTYPDPDDVLGFGELGFHTFELDDGSVLELSDGSSLGVTDKDAPILPDAGGRIAELYEV